MGREEIIYGLLVLAPFAVQLGILFATRRRLRPLRFAIPVLLGVAGVVGLLVTILSANGMWGGLYWVAFGIALLGLLLILAGWGLAWLVYLPFSNKEGEPCG